MQPRRIFSRAKLQELLKDEHSCVTVRHGKIPVLLHPWFLRDVQAGLWDSLYRKFKTYDSRLEGIIIGFDKLKTFQDEARFYGPCAEILYPVEGEVYLFEPMIGAELIGKVSVVSKDHLSCLVHDYFTVTINKPANESDKQWNQRRIKVGDRIKFEVSELDYTEPSLPTMEGSIDTVEVLVNRKRERAAPAAAVISSTQLPDDDNDEIDGELDFDAMSPILEVKPRLSKAYQVVDGELNEIEIGIQPKEKKKKKTKKVAWEEALTTSRGRALESNQASNGYPDETKKKKKRKKNVANDFSVTDGPSIPMNMKRTSVVVERVQISPEKSYAESVIEKVVAGDSSSEVDQRKSKLISHKKKKKISGEEKSEQAPPPPKKSHVESVIEKVASGDLSLEVDQGKIKPISPKKKKKISGEEKSELVPPPKKSQVVIEQVVSGDFFEVDKMTSERIPPKKKKKISGEETLDQVPPLTPPKKSHVESVIERVVSGDLSLEVDQRKNELISPKKKKKKASVEQEPPPPMKSHVESVIESVVVGSDIDQRKNEPIPAKKKKKTTDDNKLEEAPPSPKKSHIESVIEKVVTGHLNSDVDQRQCEPISAKKKKKFSSVDDEKSVPALPHTPPKKSHIESVIEKVVTGHLNSDVDQRQCEPISAKKKKKFSSVDDEKSVPALPHTPPKKSHLESVIENVVSGNLNSDIDRWKSEPTSPKKKKKSSVEEKSDQEPPPPKKSHIESVIENVVAGDLNSDVYQRKRELISPKKKKKKAPVEEKFEQTPPPPKESPLESVIEKVVAGDLSSEGDQRKTEPVSTKKKKKTSGDGDNFLEPTPPKSHIESVIEKVVAGDLNSEVDQRKSEPISTTKKKKKISGDSDEKSLPAPPQTPSKKSHLESVIEHVVAGDLRSEVDQRKNALISVSEMKKKKPSGEEKSEQYPPTSKKSHIESVIEHVVAGDLSSEVNQRKNGLISVSEKKKKKPSGEEKSEQYPPTSKKSHIESVIEKVVTGNWSPEVNPREPISAKKSKKTSDDSEKSDPAPKKSHIESVIEKVVAGDLSSEVGPGKIKPVSPKKKKKATDDDKLGQARPPSKKTKKPSVEENSEQAPPPVPPPMKSHVKSVIEMVAAGELNSDIDQSNNEAIPAKKKKKNCGSGQSSSKNKPVKSVKPASSAKKNEEDNEDNAMFYLQKLMQCLKKSGQNTQLTNMIKGLSGDDD